MWLTIILVWCDDEDEEWCAISFSSSIIESLSDSDSSRCIRPPPRSVDPCGGGRLDTFDRFAVCGRDTSPCFGAWVRRKEGSEEWGDENGTRRVSIINHQHSFVNNRISFIDQSIDHWLSSINWLVPLEASAMLLTTTHYRQQHSYSMFVYRLQLYHDHSSTTNYAWLIRCDVNSDLNSAAAANSSQHDDQYRYSSPSHSFVVAQTEEEWITNKERESKDEQKNNNWSQIIHDKLTQVAYYHYYLRILCTANIEKGATLLQRLRRYL